MDFSKRNQNEKEFGNWIETIVGGREYWFDVAGRKGGMARYVKEVDKNEVTIAFRQEIFDGLGAMIEIHEKYPVDKGHIKIQR